MTEIVLRNQDIQRGFFNRHDAQGDDRAPAFSALNPTEMLSALENHVDLLSKELMAAESMGDGKTADVIRHKIVSLRSEIDQFRQSPPR